MQAKPLYLYNTATQRKEIFTPQNPPAVSLYVCGITVYDECHLGHGRVFIVFDVLVRLLQGMGYKVKYVRNITDIDDKIILRAEQEKVTWSEIATRYTHSMQDVFNKLGLAKPDLEPKATDYMEQMFDLIQKLIAKGLAYALPSGDVYYATEKFSGYGLLGHQNLEDLRVGARVALNTEKHSPLDFVLWKSSKPNEPSWTSPWGQGRPGWHTECAAMTRDLLGETLDIHGGGGDLCFPHHENERAQCEGVSGKPFVKQWMHVGFVQVDDQKMSKSLGNFHTLRDLMHLQDPEVIRYFLISTHYRSPLPFRLEALTQARQSLNTLYLALRDIPATTPMQHLPQEAAFFGALYDDLNTPLALTVLFEICHEIYHFKKTHPEKAAQYSATLKYWGSFLGILQQEPAGFLQSFVSADRQKEIQVLVAAREEARKQREYAKADSIRQQLLAEGVLLEDTPEGTLWRQAE